MPNALEGFGLIGEESGRAARQLALVDLPDQRPKFHRDSAQHLCPKEGWLDAHAPPSGSPRRAAQVPESSANVPGAVTPADRRLHRRKAGLQEGAQYGG
eukprot:12375213-Alexandrium_andersonii.AAC.1